MQGLGGGLSSSVGNVCCRLYREVGSPAYVLVFINLCQLKQFAYVYVLFCDWSSYLLLWQKHNWEGVCLHVWQQ